MFEVGGRAMKDGASSIPWVSIYYTSLPYCNMNVYPDIQQAGMYRNAFGSDLGLVTRNYFF